MNDGKFWMHVSKCYVQSNFCYGDNFSFLGFYIVTPERFNLEPCLWLGKNGTSYQVSTIFVPKKPQISREKYKNERLEGKNYYSSIETPIVGVGVEEAPMY